MRAFTAAARGRGAGSPPPPRPAAGPWLISDKEHNVWLKSSPPTRLLKTLAPAGRRWIDGDGQCQARSAGRCWWPLGRGAEVLVQGVVLSDRRPPDDTRRRVRGELSIPDDAVVAITVANMRREKDYPNLLWAAQLALQRMPALVVLAVGQGPLADDVASLHRGLALGDSVRLLGYRANVQTCSPPLTSLSWPRP